jgi:hypothetical protein
LKRKAEIKMNQSIFPGVEWKDTDGNKIEAHGGTMFIEKNTYYWIGEDKSHTDGKSSVWTWGVNLYSSQDLYNWKKLGHIIEPSDETGSLFHPARKLDRPHLLKCPSTNKYVLWLKFSGEDADYAILQADSVTGPYSVIKEHFRPYGHKSGDFDLAQEDESGKAYLYFEADHTKMYVCQLNDTYTDITGTPTVIYENLYPPLTREAPAHFSRNGKHYLITSGMTGYIPNPSETAVSSDYMGPFTVQGDPCESDDSSATFNSQISCIFKVPQKEEYIAMADRWVPDVVMTKEKYDILLRAVQSHFNPVVKVTMEEKMTLQGLPMLGTADTSKAQYVWLPIRFEGEQPVIAWKDEWKI